MADVVNLARTIGVERAVRATGVFVIRRSDVAGRILIGIGLLLNTWEVGTFAVIADIVFLLGVCGIQGSRFFNIFVLCARSADSCVDV